MKKKTSKEKPNQLKDKIANTVVYEYLKTHQKSGVRQLALELQKEVPILLNEKVISPFMSESLVSTIVIEESLLDVLFIALPHAWIN